MKKISVIAGMFLVLSGLLAEAPRAAVPANCPTNSWTVTLNDQDQSSREDLLSVIDLLGENGGFQVVGVVSFTSSVGGRFLFVVFHPSYYRDAAVSARVKRSVLDQLAELRGIAISCDPVFTAPGGVTGSN